MIKLRDYLDSRKLTVEQFNKAPDFAFKVFVKTSDDRLVRLGDLIPFMDADVEEVTDSLKFGDNGMELTNLKIIVHSDNERLTNIVCALDNLNRVKFSLSKKGCVLTQAEMLKLVNCSIGLLEQITL